MSVVSTRTYYDVALTRGVPSSFAEALSSNCAASATISVARARSQHDAYVDVLRSLVPTVVTLPADDASPDCPFVEDTVVAVGRRAVLTRIGAVSRRGESDAVRAWLSDHDYDVTDMREACDVATCDGGDVSYPGRHLFVGLSRRTNAAAVAVLRAALPDVEVVPVPDVADITGALHLKSVVTHVDDSTLLAPVGAAADELLRVMRAAERGYDVVRLPDPRVCNVVAVNGTVLAHATDCAETQARLHRAVVEERGLRLHWSDMGEFEKCDGSLTCSSVLLRSSSDLGR